MTLVVAGVVWTGYWIASWGHYTLRGCRVGFADLAVPGRFHGCNGASKATAPSGDTQLKPAPAAQRQVGGTYRQPDGRTTTSPPSSEGYMARTPK